MSFLDKLANFHEKYQELKKPVQWAIYIFLILVLISTIIGIIFGVRSCSSKNDLTAIRYIISDETPIHNSNYNVIVHKATTEKSISIIDKKNNICSLDGNYIKIELTICQLEESTLKQHKLDRNDFKLKDHNGVYLPLNDALALLDINAIDMHIVLNDDGTFNSEADFTTKKAVKDYTWINTYLSAGCSIDLTLYFEMKEGYKVEEDIMVLEIDFLTGFGETRTGTDILLVNYKS